MNGRDRPRGPPPGPLPPRGDLQSDSGSSPSTMTRGAAFEDEKKRIIHSCFAKKDEDGLCTYTIHVLLRICPPTQVQSIVVCSATHCESDVQSLDGIATRLLR